MQELLSTSRLMSNLKHVREPVLHIEVNKPKPSAAELASLGMIGFTSTQMVDLTRTITAETQMEMQPFGVLPPIPSRNGTTVNL